MSLRFFHVLFIGISSLMALGLGLWSIDAWRNEGSIAWLALAVIALAGGGGLVVYGNRFLQKTRKLGIAVLCVAGTLALPERAFACPVCFGDTTSILRSGMNMGIFALLGVTGFMLVSFAAFFIYLAKKAKAVQGSEFKRPSSRSGSEFEIRPQEGNA